MSKIESHDFKNGGLEGYNNNSYGIFPHFTIPSIKISLGSKTLFYQIPILLLVYFQIVNDTGQKYGRLR